MLLMDGYVFKGGLGITNSRGQARGFGKKAQGCSDEETCGEEYKIPSYLFQ